MTQYEYRTDIVPMQAGKPQRNEHGQYLSGCTTEYLNEMGRQGWELVCMFPWVAREGSPLDVSGNGVRETPVLFVTLKRCLGSDTRPGHGAVKTATVGHPRY